MISHIMNISVPRYIATHVMTVLLIIMQRIISAQVCCASSSRSIAGTYVVVVDMSQNPSIEMAAGPEQNPRDEEVASSQADQENRVDEEVARADEQEMPGSQPDARPTSDAWKEQSTRCLAWLLWGKRVAPSQAPRSSGSNDEAPKTECEPPVHMSPHANEPPVHMSPHPVHMSPHAEPSEQEPLPDNASGSDDDASEDDDSRRFTKAEFDEIVDRVGKVTEDEFNAIHGFPSDRYFEWYKWSDDTWNKCDTPLNSKITWDAHHKIEWGYRGDWADCGDCWINEPMLMMQSKTDKKCYPMREMQLTVVWDCAAHQLVPRSANGQDLEFADLQWQFKKGIRWKNMSAMMNEQCLQHVNDDTLTGEYQCTHEWQNPCRQWKKTVYTVSFDKLTQTNQDSWNERPIRLVAFTMLRCGGISVKGGGGKEVPQEFSTVSDDATGSRQSGTHSSCQAECKYQ